MNEQNKARNALWRTFLVVPHKDLKLNMRRFNSIRDLAEAGLVTLLTAPSEFQIMRKSGHVLFGSLAPYQAVRVSDYIDEHLFSNRHVRSAVESYLRTLARNPARFYQDEALKNFPDSEHIFILPGQGYPGGASYKTESLGLNVHRYTVNLGDYAALDNVSKLLQQPPGKSIVDSILELDWPVTI